MPKCINHEIIGAYAQTELGHGSNLQRLETTSTYDLSTQQFIINSPTISSTKWWIGGLGILCTHAIVQARLMIKGKDYGPHTFICQIRSLEDHTLMPGIQAGEIGPKVHSGMTATDNGWAIFQNVRIPHSHMLARFSKVSLDGKYEQGPNSKLAYGGMVFIRARMIADLGWQLSKGKPLQSIPFVDFFSGQDSNVPSLLLQLSPSLLVIYISEDNLQIQN